MKQLLEKILIKVFVAIAIIILAVCSIPLLIFSGIFSLVEFLHSNFKNEKEDDGSFRTF